MELARKLLLAAFVMTAALWLLWDAGTFGLVKADPSTDRARGCYTQIEMLLGLKRPTEWIRPVEFGLGAILFIAGVLFVLLPNKSK